MRLLITIVFLALFAWFAFGAGGLPEVPGSRVQIAPEDIDRGFKRPAMGDPPTIEVAGSRMTCQECHGIFESKPVPSSPLQQHVEIDLQHGMNNRCYNCHDYGDRNFLVVQGSERIGFAEVQRLCASCHGPTFRDWEAGIHGKALGSWDTQSPERGRMSCTECHDPHHPAFSPVRPLPAPASQRGRAVHSPSPSNSGKRNPLRPDRSRNDRSPSSGH